ncbi:hypothetical protein BDK92_5613 [Micromonospora pisi]|uniref:Uncharacterized protein n=1 Tax=Micromonospora pisi TaxID=589240 RepID=A0A495JQF6_9ACTN|nr:hypothetical protein [Micromonospora pisi]RKR91220.1 hypothetical protein BDK92_5613 [Micromonospora pisi]
MRPAPGDIVYAYRKPKPPSRRRFSFRFGLQHPVLRLTPWSHRDGDGNDWISVLPVPYGVLETRLNPHNVVLIPVVDCVSYKEAVPSDTLDVICRVLDGEHPRYPWIRPDTDGEEQRTDNAYPTVREALQQAH